MAALRRHGLTRTQDDHKSKRLNTIPSLLVTFFLGSIPMVLLLYGPRMSVHATTRRSSPTVVTFEKSVMRRPILSPQRQSLAWISSLRRNNWSGAALPIQTTPSSSKASCHYGRPCSMVRSLSQQHRDPSVALDSFQEKYSRACRRLPYELGGQTTSRLFGSSTSTTMPNNNGVQTEEEQQMTMDALSMVHAAIEAVHPTKAVQTYLSSLTAAAADDNDRPRALVAGDATNRQHVYNAQDYDKVVLCAFGKASAAMAASAAQIIQDAMGSEMPLSGIVIVKDDHGTSEELEVLKELNIEVREASHPIPDERSVEAANEVLELLKQEASERTLVVCCISGGGSALFCSPRPPLGLMDLADTNACLLQSGMAIQDMNVIRKRLERGKGGKLASRFAYPSTLLTLVLSDIIGDPLDLIASGPTVPDPSNWEMAMKLVDQYQLNKGQANALPQSVLELLQQGLDGKLDNDDDDDEPSTPSHPMFCTSRGNENESSMLSETILVGNNELAVMAAAHEAKQRGYHPIVLGTRIEGEAQTVAGVYTAMAEQLSRQRQDNALLYSMCPLPAAIIAGGETTVTLKTADNGWTGKGGRNQEIGLAAALELQTLQLRNVVLASVGTDGTDGPTDAAGAIVDGGTVDRVERANHGSYTAQSALQHHDAYTFFNSMEESPPIVSSPTTTGILAPEETEADSNTKLNVLPLVKTGPTGTNVADVCVILVR